jgi:serine/threonine protein kinase
MSLDDFHGIKLITLCGGGAYGDVYYASDISGKKIAIKIISKKKLGHSWERELKGVINYRQATLAAPELLQIFHVAETEDKFYYTMEPAD